ncbi:hypothetical protein D3C72_2200020 [compost metagenome]
MTHQELPQIPDLVRCTRAACGTQAQHGPVPLATGSFQFIVGQRRDDDTWTDRVDGGTTLAPGRRLIHDPQHIAALGVLVGFQGIVDALYQRECQ